jgi:hypothetical protein
MRLSLLMSLVGTFSTGCILFEKSKEAIGRFAKEHPDVQCSFFAYYVYLSTGTIDVCIDTPENALHEAMREELFTLGRRQKLLKFPTSWQLASFYTEIPAIIDYAPNANLFQYASQAKVTFEGWTALRQSEAYPKTEKPQDDYLEGNIRIVIWKVCEQLRQDKVFLHLDLASPFRVGYQFHERPLIVLRVLNWPNSKGAPIYSVTESPQARKQ